MKKLKITISCFLLTIFFVLNPFYAFSMNSTFISNPESWYENKDIIHAPYQEIGAFSGIYSYLIDTSNHCFYLHISYSETNMKNSGNEIKVLFEINNDSNQYYLIIDENGLQNTDSTLKSAFNISVNFKNASAQGQEIYIGIEFCNKNDKSLDNLLLFSLCVNNKIYDISKNILLPFYIEETTQNNKTDKTTTEKTTKSTTEKAAKTTTGKTVSNESQNKTTDKAASSNSEHKIEETTEKETKFKYIPTISYAASASNKNAESGTNDKSSTNSSTNKKFSLKSVNNSGSESKNSSDDSGYEYIENDEIYEEYEDMQNSIIIPETIENGKQNSLSTASKILLTAAAVFICLGIAIAVYYFTKHKYESGNKTQEPENDTEKPLD